MKRLKYTTGLTLKFIQISLYFFAGLFILLLPFPYHILPNPGGLTSPFLKEIVQWLDLHLLLNEQASVASFISDSRSLYMLTALLLVISGLMGFLYLLLDKTGKQYEKIKYWGHVVVSYYLALQLFKYGFDKVFKHQFYLPEPNILFTPLGDLSKDILYWSTIGSSYPYSIFAGVLEIVPAFLLLFNRTRLLGALITIPVLLNVLMINIGFDVSVKLYSSFLLFLSLLIVSVNFRNLYSFFILNEKVQVQLWRPQVDSKKKLLFYSISKALIVGLILFESMFIYFKANNFNDDKVARPFLHGVYEVELYTRNGDTIPPSREVEGRIKRIFVHREGYFITQSMQDKMKDYKLSYNQPNQQLLLKEYDDSRIVFDYVYHAQDSSLQLNTILNTDTIKIIAQQLNLNQLPLLRDEFQWSIENY